MMNMCSKSRNSPKIMYFEHFLPNSYKVWKNFFTHGGEEWNIFFRFRTRFGRISSKSATIEDFLPEFVQELEENLH